MQIQNDQNQMNTESGGKNAIRAAKRHIGRERRGSKREEKKGSAKTKHAK
jgi:hypothetical protein